jgi:adenylosuccinate synthase
VLSGIDPLRVCVAYELAGRRLDHPPAGRQAWGRIRPIYEDLPGWKEPLGTIRALKDLPTNARNYVERLSTLVGAPIGLVSIGAQRDQTIFHDPHIRLA